MSERVKERVRAFPKQNRSQQTRRRLIRAAEKLFSKKGVDETTTNEISKKAGVSVGIFYKYFRDKRDIFLEVYRNYSWNVEKTVVAQLDQEKWKNGDFYTLMRSVLTAGYESHVTNPVLLQDFARIALKDPEFQKVHEEVRERGRQMFRSFLEYHIDKLKIRNIPLAAFIIDEASESCLHKILFFGMPFDKEEVIDGIARMTCAYLLCECPSNILAQQ